MTGPAPDSWPGYVPPGHETTPRTLTPLLVITDRFQAGERGLLFPVLEELGL